ncbi:MAG: hypothetical protein IV103_05080, partial [Zoogloea sp.]|nr:hypothetical protein [Zoogloea sp.]
MSAIKQGHEPFSWLTDDARRIPGVRLVERVHDTAAGIALHDAGMRRPTL